LLSSCGPLADERLGTPFVIPAPRLALPPDRDHFVLFSSPDVLLDLLEAGKRGDKGAVQEMARNGAVTLVTREPNVRFRLRSHLRMGLVAFSQGKLEGLRRWIVLPADDTIRQVSREERGAAPKTAGEAARSGDVHLCVDPWFPSLLLYSSPDQCVKAVNAVFADDSAAFDALQEGGGILKVRNTPEMTFTLRFSLEMGEVEVTEGRHAGSCGWIVGDDLDLYRETTGVDILDAYERSLRQPVRGHGERGTPNPRAQTGAASQSDGRDDR
jgi:hypothetical protein